MFKHIIEIFLDYSYMWWSCSLINHLILEFNPPSKIDFNNIVLTELNLIYYRI